MDGTLVDSWPAIHDTFVYLLNRFRPGSSIAHLEEAKMSSLAYMDLFRWAFQDNQIPEEYLQEGNRYYESIMPTHTPLFPGAAALLAEFSRRHIPWGIVTSKRRFFLNKLLKEHSCLNTCGCVVTEEDVTHLKPDPEPLLLGLKRLSESITPRTAVYIGDSETDMLAAHRAGMSSILIRHKPLLTSKVDAWPINATAQSFLELI